MQPDSGSSRLVGETGRGRVSQPRPWGRDAETSVSISMSELDVMMMDDTAGSEDEIAST
jgi:hypothetical protein